MVFNLIGISAKHSEISSLHIRKSLCKDIFFVDMADIVHVLSN